MDCEFLVFGILLGRKFKVWKSCKLGNIVFFKCFQQLLDSEDLLDLDVFYYCQSNFYKLFFLLVVYYLLIYWLKIVRLVSMY